jgi:hypothetical protein
MKLMRKAIVGVATLGALLSTTSFANDVIGQLNGVSGNVLIERNGEFLVASNESGLLQGDRVVALEGSTVVVDLAEGCSSQLNEASAINIGSENFCSNIVQVAELSATDKAAGGSISTLSVAPLGSFLIPVLIGGAVIGVVVAVSSNDDPSSP